MEPSQPLRMKITRPTRAQGSGQGSGPMTFNSDYLNGKLQELNKYAEQGVTAQEIIAKMTQASVLDELDKWVTNDPDMLKVKRKICAIKDADLSWPVLITGPTGTGKELLARALRVTDQPFLAVNCGGLPRDLVPSIFFGYVRGAFTGANSDKEGVLIAAKQGVVFLDEIADMPLELQATLLRSIQENEVYPVGSVVPHKIQCRFVAATKYDLRDRVEQGLFREDLFARLYTYEIQVTGLQQRPDDIPLIAKYLGWENAIPEDVRADIFKFNVRAIQTYIARMKTFGYYV